MTEKEALSTVLNSTLDPSDKAKAVIAVNNGRAVRRQNFILLLLTLVIALAAVLQAYAAWHAQPCPATAGAPVNIQGEQ